MKRGDVVIVEFPYVDGRRGKNRPSVVLQNDRDNQRLNNTVVAMISGNIRHAGEGTQVLVDPATVMGKSSGLHGPFVVKCCNLFTIAQSDVLRVVGCLTSELLAEVNEARRVALDLD